MSVNKENTSAKVASETLGQADKPGLFNASSVLSVEATQNANTKAVQYILEQITQRGLDTTYLPSEKEVAQGIPVYNLQCEESILELSAYLNTSQRVGHQWLMVENGGDKVYVLLRHGDLTADQKNKASYSNQQRPTELEKLQSILSEKGYAVVNAGQLALKAASSGGSTIFHHNFGAAQVVIAHGPIKHNLDHVRREAAASSVITPDRPGQSQ